MLAPLLVPPARGGFRGGGRGFRGGHVGLPRGLGLLGHYPFLTLALLVLVVAGVWLYLRSRRG